MEGMFGVCNKKSQPSVDEFTCFYSNRLLSNHLRRHAHYTSCYCRLGFSTWYFPPGALSFSHIFHFCMKILEALEAPRRKQTHETVQYCVNKIWMCWRLPPQTIVKFFCIKSISFVINPLRAVQLMLSQWVFASIMLCCCAVQNCNLVELVEASMMGVDYVPGRDFIEGLMWEVVCEKFDQV